jgi:hypothetical protein
MTVQTAPRTNACPSCGGCLPCEGLPHQVCRCGSDWGDPLLELIRLLDELLSDPPPPDSRPEEDPR